MVVSGYLIVTPKQSGSSYYPRKSAEVRYVKTKPTLRAKEIAFEMDITLPDTLWARPTPQIKLDVPKDVLYDMDAKVAVQMITPEIADALKVDIKTVQDGLTEMLRVQAEADNG